MKYCPSCGNEIIPNSKFCNSCGFNIEQVFSGKLDSGLSDPESRSSRISPSSEISSANDFKSKKNVLWAFIGIVAIVGFAIFLNSKSSDNSNLNNSVTTASTTQQSTSTENSSVNNDPGAPDPNETLAPDPSSGVDISDLPRGHSGSNAYKYGVSEAQSAIQESALTRATYDQLGGLKQSCKYVLDTFMALQGGSSTRQQYADFLLGCATVVKNWY